MQPSPVFIERLVVEEGFLDDLDLEFAPGLNVIIGPRGVGKTSVIQLLRFCLGVPAFSEAFDIAAQTHATNILGEDGRVSVRLSIGGETVVVSRRKHDEAPEGYVETAPRPLFLAQTEIEEIGVDPEGRLRLVDDFRSDGRRLANKERAAVSTVESLTVELADLDAQIEKLEAQVVASAHDAEQLREAEKEVSVAEKSADAAANDLQQLNDLGKQVAASQARFTVIKRTSASLEGWIQHLMTAHRQSPPVEDWPSQTDNPLGGARQKVDEVTSMIEDAIASLTETVDALKERLDSELAEVNRQEDEARTLRRRVDEVQEGAGAAVRRLGLLRERAAQLSSLSEHIQEQKRRCDVVRGTRDEALVDLDGVREERFQERVDVARRLGEALGPRIEVDVRRSGFWSRYADAIAGSIRGSGLHYSELAPQLAESLSPSELARAVEADDAATIATGAGIPESRARRVIDRLKESGVGNFLTAPIEDSVQLKLLDGSDYKSSELLSTGQRCTTVLPIILRHEERPVVIDQPEDHLDGAFIVDTLVKAILGRPDGSQLIMSTHNPNIPVLGDAARVTLLGSDGARGFERHSGGLQDPEIVHAITSIMEGGKEAFRRRAEFYGPD